MMQRKMMRIITIKIDGGVKFCPSCDKPTDAKVEYICFEKDSSGRDIINKVHLTCKSCDRKYSPGPKILADLLRIYKKVIAEEGTSDTGETNPANADHLLEKITEAGKKQDEEQKK